MLETVFEFIHHGTYDNIFIITWSYSLSLLHQHNWYNDIATKSGTRKGGIHDRTGGVNGLSNNSTIKFYLWSKEEIYHHYMHDPRGDEGLENNKKRGTNKVELLSDIYGIVKDLS